MSDILNSDLGFPVKPDHCGGQPALQAASEASARCEARKKAREENPGALMADDWEQVHNDYEAIEHGERMFGSDWPRTFEPGDAFVPKRKE